jgi:hypothetical protein
MGDYMGRAEDLFIRIRHGGAEEIERMIREQVAEELFLDYKRAATISPFGKLDPSDRKNLAKATAGFANSEGGIIIWGVDCRQNPPNGDVPTWPPFPISNPTAFKSLLEGAITGVTLPAHCGVENMALQISGQSDGFVVTHIPSGMHVPYRTLTDKEEYYIRAGSNFSPTPHAVLAGLFGRTPQPQLCIAVKLRKLDDQNGGCQITLDVEILNNGRGLADDIFLNGECTGLPTRASCYWHVNTDLWDRWSRGNQFTIVSKTFSRLPPGSGRDILEICLQIFDPIQDDVVLAITCGSRNGPGTARTIIFPHAVIARVVEHYIGDSPRNPRDRMIVEKMCLEHIMKCLSA